MNEQDKKWMIRDALTPPPSPFWAHVGLMVFIPPVGVAWAINRAVNKLLEDKEARQ